MSTLDPFMLEITMRPDKKKKVHHDSQKAKNRALASANTAVSDKPKPKKTGHGNQTQSKLDEAGSSKSLICESAANLKDIDNKVHANDQADEEEDSKSHKDYSRRIIESNWTKYAMPQSDSDNSEEETTMTGLDFNDVVQNSRSSESMFRLKSEKEWEEKQNLFTNEIFSMDLTNVEKVLSCVPLPVQLGISKSEFQDKLFCPQAYDYLNERAKENYENLRKESACDSQEDIETINQRLIAMLATKSHQNEITNNSADSQYVGSSGGTNNLQSIVKSDNIEFKESHAYKEQEFDSNNKVKDTIDDLEFEQLLNKDNNQKTNNIKELKSSQKPKSTTPETPKSREIEAALPNVLSVHLTQKDTPNEIETENKTCHPINVEENNKSLSEFKNDDTKNLEDWLDDFLSD